MRRSRKRAGGGSGEGNKMDPNLTSPIVLNAVLNATLNQPPQPWWFSLIPLLMPLLVVFLGAYGTYYVSIQLGNRKNQYDLKVKIYFELLDTINLLKAIEESLEIIAKLQEGEFKNKMRHDEALRFNEANKSFKLILPKLRIVCNTDVQDKLIDLNSYLSSANATEYDPMVSMEKQIDLTQAIRDDLASGKGFGPSPFIIHSTEAKHWWQFRK